MTILDIIYQNSVDNPGKICLKYEDEDFTYSQLWSAICRTAGYFQDQIPVDKKLLLMLPNSVEFVVYLLGAMLAKRIPVIADPKLNHEIVNIIKENNITMIAALGAVRGKVADICIEHDIVVSYADCKVTGCGSSVNNKQPLKQASGFMLKQVSEQIKQDDMSLILYTSGSVSKPKGVVNTHQTLYHASLNYLRTVNISQGDILLGVTPFFHSYSLGSCLIAGLCTGACIVIVQEFTPKKVLALIESHSITIFHGVPYMYDLVNRILTGNTYNISSLRLCISAGMRLGTDTAKTFYNLSKKVIHQEYGSTESGTIAINLSDNFQLNIDSAGKPLDGVAVKTDENNILSIKSKGRAIGYINSQPFNGQWYSTGDIVTINSEGYIVIDGRVKRMINIVGVKVNPVEVEAVIKQHGCVTDVYVSAAKHNVYGEVVKAVVAINKPVTAEELKSFCSSRIAPYKVPRIIKFTDDLQKSQLGKIKAEEN